MYKVHTALVGVHVAYGVQYHVTSTVTGVEVKQLTAVIVPFSLLPSFATRYWKLSPVCRFHATSNYYCILEISSTKPSRCSPIFALKMSVFVIAILPLLLPTTEQESSLMCQDICNMWHATQSLCATMSQYLLQGLIHIL
jgi:hypothetical protein